MGRLFQRVLNRRGCLFHNSKEIQLGFQKTGEKTNKNLAKLRKVGIFKVFELSMKENQHLNYIPCINIASQYIKIIFYAIFFFANDCKLAVLNLNEKALLWESWKNYMIESKVHSINYTEQLFTEYLNQQGTSQ